MAGSFFSIKYLPLTTLATISLMPKDSSIKEIFLKMGGALILIAPVVFLSVAVYSFGIFNKDGESLKAEEIPAVKGISTSTALSLIEKVLDLPPETIIISQDKTLCGIRVSLRSKHPADKILSFYLDFAHLIMGLAY